MIKKFSNKDYGALKYPKASAIIDLWFECGDPLTLDLPSDPVKLKEYEDAFNELMKKDFHIKYSISDHIFMAIKGAQLRFYNFKIKHDRKKQGR